MVKVENEQAYKREKFDKDIAEANLREEAFHTYIDRMSEIIINKTSRSELFSNNSDKISSNDWRYDPTKKYKRTQDNSIQDVARVRTITILRRLENDIERQNRIIDFLHDSELLQFLLRTPNLSGVNIRNVNINNVNLSNANLSGANLSGA